MRLVALILGQFARLQMRPTSCVDMGSIVRFADGEAMNPKGASPTDLLSEKWRGLQEMLICNKKHRLLGSRRTRFGRGGAGTYQ